jgi:hypothetical protein
MRKFILITTAAALVAAASVGPAGAGGASRLIVAMRDPGCHWFYIGGGSGHRKYVTSVVRSGPVALVNLDEATLKIKGPSGTRMDRMGAALTLKTKGVYAITMVKQASDDNHLRLTIK